ncbi:MAG: hypothetical protein WCR06_07775 [bacterium]
MNLAQSMPAKSRLPACSVARVGLLCGIVLATAATRLYGQLTIARPNFGVPEFVEIGSTFQVEVKAAAGLNSTQWVAALANDLRIWTGTVEQVSYGTYADNGTVAGYRLRVRLPSGIPPEVFKLAVAHPSAGIATNRNAVSVLNCVETNFYIFHYADPQAEAYEPNNTDTGMYGTHGSVRELFWHAPAVRLANPRFMFDTGDELDNAYGTSVARYNEYKDGMCSMGVAVLATRGNNDNAITTADWRANIGIETYSITMGSFYVCQKDVRENTYTTWFTNDYTAAFANTNIRYRLFGQHFNSNGDAKCPYFYAPVAGQYPNLMLLGHGHVNATIQSSPYTVLETQQACNKGAIGFFNFVRGATTWTCTTQASPWFQLMTSGSAAKLTSAYAVANNGSQFTNTVVITNTLAANFWDGRIRFLAPAAAMGYQVTGGTILSQYDYNGGTNAAVLVKVNIPASSVTTVSIVRVDTDQEGMADDWERACFGTLATADATTDSDGDGMLDRHEYLAGTAPTNRQSVLMLAQPVFSAGGTQIEIPWASASNKSYALMQSTNLALSFSIPLQAHIPATPPMNIWTTTVPASVAGMFFRVELE